MVFKTPLTARPLVVAMETADAHTIPAAALVVGANDFTGLLSITAQNDEPSLGDGVTLAYVNGGMNFSE